ncbi:MAG: oxalate/formate MFS antiporter [Bradyrhizobiaceae bacterium]|nr:MAG: oxalate/formate MFS antiporter [Bradyrhizobiaceae bacterium]
MTGLPKADINPGYFRWFQLICGIICMATIANLQYGWTLFVDPIDTKFHWGRAAIQLSFTIFVVVETWLVPFKAWFVDKYGPSRVVAFGAIGIALGWVINSQASSIMMLYLGAFVSGIGAAAIWSASVGNALKWFPDRRGLAAGLTIAGFGAGAAITIVPIANSIAANGYERTFLWFGIGQGVIALIMGLCLRRPSASVVKLASDSVLQTSGNTKPVDAVKTPVFWLMYVMFVLVASCGLMAIAQLGPYAKDLKIANIPVSPFGIEMTILTLAISLDRITDGIGRPLFGYISDRIGRENTMFIAFGVGAVALMGLSQFGSNPALFIVMTPLYFWVFGEIFTLFPSICADTFGNKYATTNAGLLYTAKGTAALIVPAASIVAASHGWSTVFGLASAFNLTAALLAIFALKPLRRRYLAKRAIIGEASSTPSTAHAVPAE